MAPSNLEQLYPGVYSTTCLCGSHVLQLDMDANHGCELYFTMAVVEPPYDCGWVARIWWRITTSLHLLMGWSAPYEAVFYFRDPAHSKEFATTILHHLTQETTTCE